MLENLLGMYVIMQQAEWAGRMFYQAQDRLSGHVVYLIAEPAHGSTEPYRHANLPPLEHAATEGPIRWLTGCLTEGESLEDMRRAGTLTEQEILTVLLSVLDGLASLSQLHPPVVPAYLDPSCIKRDELGRWTLDYLSLAQATEARGTGTPPLGVYPFGVLLYWLATGQAARRTRIQVNRVTGISAALQFILIRCLGRAYPSLAELRADIERAGREREFRALVRLIGGPADIVPVLTAAPVVGVPSTAPTEPDLPMELRRVTMGGPFIPADDRPWALPPRPAEGFRKLVVPPEPDPRLRRAARWGLTAVGSFVLLVITGATLLRMGVIPALRPDSAPPSVYPDLARSDGEVGQELPPDPPGPGDSLFMPDKQEVRERTPQPPPAPVVPEPPPTKKPTPPPTRPKPPAPRPTEPTAPQQPQPPTLQPGTTDYEDAKLGALPVLVHLDGQTLGYAYMFPSSRSPYISLEAFNRLFGRNLFWAPHEGGQIRLLVGTQVVITPDFSLVDDRVWLKLTTSLQESLGLQLQVYSAEGIYFSTVR